MQPPPVSSLFASRRIPLELREECRRSPGAFPPSLLLEHVSGCVSSLVPVPHAGASSAFRCTLSARRARLDLALPDGGLERTSIDRNAAVKTSALASAEGHAQPFAWLMQELVDAFVGAAKSRAAPPCSLRDEAQVREVWSAIPRALRSGARAEVAPA